MRVCILHHHLETGGVTNVIHSQIESYGKSSGDAIQVCLLLGRSPQHLPSGVSRETVYINPLLDYFDCANKSVNELRKYKVELKSFLSEQVKPGDILHIHNLNLGQNPLLNVALYEMACVGCKVLNHCHDFAEDGRFANYEQLLEVVEGVFRYSIGDVLYPSLPNYHYGVINSRDANILRSFLPEERVHFLLNPVSIPSPSFTRQQHREVREGLNISDDHHFVLYAVRGIRRKNIGEWVLLSALFKERSHWALSQPATDEVERPSYDFWREYAFRRQLPTIFEAGNKVPFEGLLKAADRWVTTSVVEGFGMSFLEPWLHHKPLIGRNIPMVTQDFASLGLQLESLYSSIRVPKSWVSGVKKLEKEYVEWIGDFYQEMSLEGSSDLFQSLVKSIRREKFSKNWLDFGHLDRGRQREVIEKVLKKDGDRQALIAFNQLEQIWEPPLKALLQHNRRLVQKCFGVRAYGKSLRKVYQELATPKGIQRESENGFGRTWAKELRRTAPLRQQNPGVEHFLSSENFYLIQK